MTPLPRGPAVLAALLLAAPAVAQKPSELRPTCYAVKDAKVVVEPGTVLPKATVVVREGVITGVGEGVPVPPDAAVTDGKGLTVYAGFVDAGSPRGYDAELRRSAGGPPAPEDLAAGPLAATKPDHRKGLTPEFAVATALKLDEDAVAPWRKAGFTAHLVTPDGGFLSGTSALVSLSGAVPREAVLRSPVALHAAFRPQFGGGYPVALMGVVAHARQVMLDAGWLKRQWAAFEGRGRSGKRPPVDPCLESLRPALEGKLPVAFEADTADQIHRALDYAGEFGLRPVIVGGKDAWKVASRLKAENVPVILRLAFAEPAERENEYPVRVREDRERVRAEEAGCAAALHKAGVRFAFATQGVTGGERANEKFRENLRKAIAAGLPADAALAALTRDAADILGAGSQLGKVARGRPAHLTVCDGEFHAAGTKVKYVFADGVRIDPEERPDTPPAEVAETGRGGRRGNRPDPNAPPATTPAGPRPTGTAPPADRAVANTAGPRGGRPGAAGAAATKPFSGIAFRALVPVLDAVERLSTETEADRKPALKTGGDLLLRGATVLTAGKPPAVADVLVRAGKIAEVGPGLAAPAGVTTIEAAGMFVMPGIIDTHSHFAISGGVNEASLSVVPEVRVRDAIDAEDVQIYRALGGGVTTARLLHGSANVVGGQDAVIKMKYGRPAKEMLVDGPRGVKFALGENVKRTDGRFPNSRLGVEAVLVRAFTEAKAYRKTWDDYERSKTSSEPLPEPRRDLRLEALADVLSGDLRIHSHCYRADEILMLLRVADRFGVKVRSLQHVLEGYKVAPEIAAHGASVSLFSDWWAYKVEAYDAIPYAAKLLQDAGATVCLKSDDNELMRHLYQEAAKMVKYGGLTADEALRTITLNPAKQLGIDDRTGSIEAGKAADLAVFNGHPLNAYSRCEMTIVDGEVYFQRADKLVPFPPARDVPAAATATFAAIPDRAKGVYALRGATVHPAGKPAFRGTVVISDGVIAAVKEGDADVPAGATVVEAAGRHVYPGMIDAGTVLGLIEIESARETIDYRDGGDFQPDLRAAAGINPDSELLPVTRANGVTTAVVRPTGSLMPGQGALVNLAGWVPAEMVAVDPLALHLEYPAEPTPRGFGTQWPGGGDENRQAARRARDEKLRRLRELFEQTRRYAAGRAADANLPVNPRFDALVPYARGEKPVVIEANRKADILAAVKLAEELKVRPILSGGAEAWKCAPELVRRNVPVILGPVMAIAREPGDRYDATYAAAAELHRAGVRFCIRSAGGSNARNLPYEAATAVAYGLPPEEGLRAVTQYPAEILGVADRFGDVAAGRRANLVVATGDVLQPTTQVLAVFVDGRPYEPTSKQTRLYDRYRKRLTEVQGEKAGGK
jgi:imidazolonepropionase-like amidohydrolase